MQHLNVDRRALRLLVDFADIRDDLLFDTRQAAHRLEVSIAFLDHHRNTGLGPEFVNQGRRVYYSAGALKAWLRLRAAVAQEAAPPQRGRPVKRRRPRA